jgi:hypothetical protein
MPTLKPLATEKIQQVIAGRSTLTDISRVNFLGFQQALQRVMRPGKEETVKVELEVLLESGQVRLSVMDKAIPKVFHGQRPPRLNRSRIARVGEVWDELSHSLFSDPTSDFLPITAVVEERLQGVAHAYQRLTEAKAKGINSSISALRAIREEVRALVVALYGGEKEQQP